MQIWPWLKRWLERVRAWSQGNGRKAGGLAADNRAAVGFLELLVLLHDVLLQDLAILQKRKSPSLIFKHMLTHISTDYPELPLF
jgi:hypothetical protein